MESYYPMIAAAVLGLVAIGCSRQTLRYIGAEKQAVLMAQGANTPFVYHSVEDPQDVWNNPRNSTSDTNEIPVQEVVQGPFGTQRYICRDGVTYSPMWGPAQTETCDAGRPGFHTL